VLHCSLEGLGQINMHPASWNPKWERGYILLWTEGYEVGGVACPLSFLWADEDAASHHIVDFSPWPRPGVGSSSGPHPREPSDAPR